MVKSFGDRTVRVLRHPLAASVNKDEGFRGFRGFRGQVLPFAYRRPQGANPSMSSEGIAAKWRTLPVSSGRPCTR